MNDLWNYIITAVGLLGFFLAGKKVWWCWYVNIANQVLWFAYGWVTEQWGFVVGTFAYTFVFVKNAISWTRDHQQEKKYTALKAQGRLDAISIGFKLDTQQFSEGVLFAQEAIDRLAADLHRRKKWNWLPKWIRKRIFKVPVKWDGGAKIGEVKSVEERDGGLYVTSEIDRSTADGAAAWEAIHGPYDKYSVAVPKKNGVGNILTDEAYLENWRKAHPDWQQPEEQ